MEWDEKEPRWRWTRWNPLLPTKTSRWSMYGTNLLGSDTPRKYLWQPFSEIKAAIRKRIFGRPETGKSRDYLTKGAIFYGDRIGFGLGTSPNPQGCNIYLFPNALFIEPFHGIGWDSSTEDSRHHCNFCQKDCTHLKLHRSIQTKKWI
jgi:hypothetical protein